MTTSKEIKSQETGGKSRRDFLKLAGTAPVAAAATAVGSQAAADEATPDGNVMRDTDHTRTYYALARF